MSRRRCGQVCPPILGSRRRPVTGRADVILDQEGGVPMALAIVDYKTATHGEIDDHLARKICWDLGIPPP